MSWEPTDVAFDLAPGHHRVALAAPGCATPHRHLDIAQLGPTFMQGRLAIDDPSLMGNTGAPDGLSYTFGYYQTSLGAKTSSTTFVDTTTQYTQAPLTLQGGTFGMWFERRRTSRSG